MAAGEYVSVSSQSDTEQVALARERRELDEAPTAEREELAGIYVARGLDHDLALNVADQLMAKEALGAKAGGASIPRATARVAFWGPAAMAVTAGIGHLVGKAV